MIRDIQSGSVLPNRGCLYALIAAEYVELDKLLKKAAGEGGSILADRLWPRGSKREKIENWIRELGPSDR